MPLMPEIAPAGFSLAEALACAEASAQAYDSPATLESELAHVLIIEKPEANYVAFKGSAGLRDFLTDARCWLEEHVHAGFLASFNSIALPLMAALAKLPEEKPIFFTGHSKGGAEAVEAGWFFRSHFPNAKVYSFGQPRVGDAQFAAMCEQRLAGRHFRFVNQEDAIPRSPLWLRGYRHSGQEIFLPALGRGLKFGAPLWLKLLSDAYGLYLEYRKHRLALLADHGISHYLERLKSVPDRPSNES